MTKSHLKKICAPKSWLFERKETTYVTRPFPGPHKLDEGVSLSFLLKHILKFAKTEKETRYILQKQNVQVDGKQKKDPKTMIGLMDVISFPTIKKAYKVALDKRGNLTAEPVDEKETNKKTCVVANKTQHKGKIQLGLSDGRTLLLDPKKADYAVGDSLVIEVPSQKIVHHITLAKGTTILLRGGKHKGKKGVVVDITGNDIAFSIDKETYTTKKRHAYPIEQ